jgi:hypothetical protein
MLQLAATSTSSKPARSRDRLNPSPRRTIRAAISGEPDNLVLVHLRRLDEKMIGDVEDLEHRVTSLEGQMASIRGDLAAMSLRIDRFEAPLDGIERRLDLAAASPA